MQEQNIRVYKKNQKHTNFKRILVKTLCIYICGEGHTTCIRTRRLIYYIVFFPLALATPNLHMSALLAYARFKCIVIAVQYVLPPRACMFCFADLRICAIFLPCVTNVLQLHSMFQASCYTNTVLNSFHPSFPIHYHGKIVSNRYFSRKLCL